MFGLGILMVLFVALPVAAQEKKTEKGKTEKAKAEKVAGDIGLLDTEKNYMIVVTKDGKLVTIDFDQRTKVTALVPSPAKMSDVGLGSAASIQYTKKGDKNYLTGIEYRVKKAAPAIGRFFRLTSLHRRGGCQVSHGIGFNH
jgi:hypothetical protein